VVPALAHAARDPDESVRGAAIGFLSTRPGEAATRALIEMLGRPEVRDRAIAALAVVADERVDGLLAALETADADLASSLGAALVRLRRPSAQAALAAALSFENVAARRAAAVALASVGTPAAQEALARAASTDPDPEIRRIAKSTG
jgi:HEAT repeat protein